MRKHSRRRFLAVATSSALFPAAGCAGYRLGDPEETETPTPLSETDVDCDPTDFPDPASDPPDGAWVTRSGSQRRTGSNPSASLPELSTVSELEANELFRRNKPVGWPVIAGLEAYVFREGSHTELLDLEDGTVKTSRRTASRRAGPLALTTDAVYVLSQDSLIYALDRDLKRSRWISDVGEGEIRTGPVTADGTLVVGHGTTASSVEDTENWYTGIDLQCGAERWSWKVEGKFHRGPSTDGRTFYATADTGVYAFEARSGSEKWQVDVNLPENDHLNQPPSIANDVLILRSRRGRLIALSPDDGSLLWDTPEGIMDHNLPVVTLERTFAVKEGREEMVCLDTRTGEHLYTYSDAARFTRSPILYADGSVYYMTRLDDHDYGIRELDSETGTVKGSAPFSYMSTNVPESSWFAVTNDGFFTLSDEGEAGSPVVFHKFTI